MKRHPVVALSGVSRRSILGRGGVIAAALGLGRGVRHATARAASPELETHPIVGVWLAITPAGPTPAHILANGSFIASSSPINIGPDGAITYISAETGVWEPDSERGIHFTSVQHVRDATGTLVGTVTVDGYPVASEDSESFYDDGTRVRVTFRDPDGTVTMVLGEDGSLPPVYGNRMRPGAPGFQEGTPEAGTPTS